MLSDVDEIPNPKRMTKFNIKNKYFLFYSKKFSSKNK